MSTEGLFGRVIWVEGNRMPMITEEGQPVENGGGVGVKRTIYIFKAISAAAVEQQEGFFKLNLSDAVAVIETDPNGRFFVALPPGKYSILSKEERGLWAGIFDAENHLNPIRVEKGNIAEMTLEINYMAFY